MGNGLNQRAGNSGLHVSGASLWVSFGLSGKMKIDGTFTFHSTLRRSRYVSGCFEIFGGRRIVIVLV